MPRFGMGNLVSGCWLLNLKVRHLGTLITSFFLIYPFDYFSGVKNLWGGGTFFCGGDSQVIWHGQQSDRALRLCHLGVLSDLF